MSPVLPSEIEEKFVERLVPGSWAWSLDICAHAQRYRFASRFVPGKRVLDAGCGAGYGSRMLACLGASEVIGVDISEDALSVARSQFAHPRVKFIQDDCELLQSVRGTFDVVVCLENLEHLNRPEQFLARAAEVLHRNGILICSTPQSLGGSRRSENPYHIREYAIEEFQELLQQYFSNVVISGQDITATARAIHALWTNPFVRIGRWLQELRGRKVPSPNTLELPLTEGDFVISEFNIQTARVLVAVCERPL